MSCLKAVVAALHTGRLSYGKCGIGGETSLGALEDDSNEPRGC